MNDPLSHTVSHRIEIMTRPDLPDPVGRSLLERIRTFGGPRVDDIRTCAVYRFSPHAIGDAGEMSAEALRELGAALYADPVLNHCTVNGEGLSKAAYDWYVEVGYRPGVTDNVGRTAQESLEYKLGRPLAEGHHVHSSIGYFIRGDLTRHQAHDLAAEWVANELIQQLLVLGPEENGDARQSLFNLPRVDLHTQVKVERFTLESPEEMMRLSKARLLALSPEEAAIICEYFARPEVIAQRKAAGLEIEGAQATDVELEVLAQTWSEHCKHKIFNAHVNYTDENGHSEEIKSLFKTYIQGATKSVRAALGKDDF